MIVCSLVLMPTHSTLLGSLLGIRRIGEAGDDEGFSRLDVAREDMEEVFPVDVFGTTGEGEGH
jgi:hypothetical protein